MLKSLLNKLSNKKTVEEIKSVLSNNGFNEAFYKRLSEISGTRKSNCIGTAMYLAGEREKDRSIDIGSSSIRATNSLNRVEKPTKGGLISWEDDEGPYHLAFVVEVDPLVLIHRDGCDGPVEINVPYDEVNKEYYEDGSIIGYFFSEKSPVIRD